VVAAKIIEETTLVVVDVAVVAIVVDAMAEAAEIQEVFPEIPMHGLLIVRFRDT